jgi:integrase
MSKNYWTNTSIHKLPPTKGEADHIVWHPTIDRFGVRFAGGKPAAYVIMYFLGRDRKRTVGKVSQIDLDVAIERAKADFALVRDGVDPAIEHKVKVDIHSDLFIDHVGKFLDAQKAAGLSDAYLQTQTGHLQGYTHKKTGEFLPAYFAALHNIPVKLIDRRLVSTELDKITAERGQISMTNARATLSKFFSWMIQRHIVENNPVTGTEKIYADTIDRTLTIDELKIVWNAADPSWQFGRILRLLILTGGRRDQLGGLKKTELDLDGAMITLPRKATLRQRKRGDVKSRRGGSKNGETFQIPLSKQAVELFRQEKMSKPEYVFGDLDGAGGFSGWSKTMPKLYELIGDQIKEHWSLHDIRRSFATIAVENLDADPIVADACINHKPASMTKGVMGVYQKAKLLEKRIELMNKWGAFIEEITKPAKPDLRVVA